MSLSSVCVVTNALRLKRFKTRFNKKVNYKNKIQENKFKEEKKMNTKTIIIKEMQCNHCKTTVEKALSSLDGVVNVEVSLENKTAVIESVNDIPDSKIKETIEAVGFNVK